MRSRRNGILLLLVVGFLATISAILARTLLPRDGLAGAEYLASKSQDYAAASDPQLIDVEATPTPIPGTRLEERLESNSRDELVQVASFPLEIAVLSGQGEALSDAKVWAEIWDTVFVSVSSFARKRTVFDALADADGLARWKHPVKGAVLFASAPGYGPRCFIVPRQDEFQRRIITLDQAATLFGEVAAPIDSGWKGIRVSTPLTAISVYSGDEANRLQEYVWEGGVENGGYLVDGLTANVPLRADLVCANAMVWSSIFLEEGLRPGEVRRLNFLSREYGVIRGIVRSSRDFEVAGRRVVLVKSNAVDPDETPIGPLDKVVLAARLDESGEFRFQVPTGKWRVGVSTTEKGGAISSPTACVTLDPGAEPFVELWLQELVSIEGIVLGLDGYGEREVSVMAIHVGAPDATYLGLSGEDGRFRIGPLLPGNYVLQPLSPERGNFSNTLVAAGDTGVTLILIEALGAISVEVVRVGANEAEHTVQLTKPFDVQDLSSLWRSVARTEDCRATWNKVEAGFYDAIATTDDGAIGVAKSVYCEPGGSPVTVAIEPEPAGVLSIRRASEAEVSGFVVVSDGVAISMQGIADEPVEVLVPKGRCEIYGLLESAEGELAVAQKVLVDVAGQSTASVTLTD